METMYKKVLDLKNISLVSINEKYINKKFATSKEYKDYKEMVFLCCKKGKLYNGKISLKIIVWTNKDIDNVLKPTIDGLERIIKNDRNILELIVQKIEIKRDEKEAITVYIKELYNE